MLDHIIWQIANRHKPNRPDNDKKRNMFPLCSTRGEFRDQVSRKRLNGLPVKAVKLVERIQPYHRKNQLLGVLGELENIDKHRTLVVVNSVTSGVFSVTLQEHGLSLPYDEDWYSDGTIVVRINRRVLPPRLIRLLDRPLEGASGTYAIFQDPPAAGLEVESTLQQLKNLIGNVIIPGFKPFFD